MKYRTEEDGWDSHQPDQNRPTTDVTHCPRTRFKSEAREVLDQDRHSLIPDMVFGWRPKLPSCPLPLAYVNSYTDALLSYLPSDDRFKLIFLGPRCSNSVQVNQQYHYPWRYRARYNTSIEEVKQSIKQVGNNGKRYHLDPSPSQVQFDSSFESGNLDMAIRVKKNEYDLFLRSDTNTRGHTCWYYFKVNNKDLTGEVQFNICNFAKRKNLYPRGLRPYELVEGGNWKQDNCYEVNFVQRLCRYGFDRKAFQLQFKYNFKQRNQTVYFAYSIPYTYSKLHAFITETNLKNNQFVEYSKLCQTLGGLEVPLLKITGRNEDKENCDQSNGNEIKRKKIVLITSRIHPGEPHASYLAEGLIRFLISDDPNSKMLRKCFIFYIVPMLNPDGVIAGNFRTSYSGKDLNRQFNQLNKFIFPQITALHDFASHLKRNHHTSFQYYFDLHAHSSIKGMFCYGPEHLPGRTEFFRARALAKFIEQRNPIFNYRRSVFTVDNGKKNTGRAHMLWKLNIPMSFTFEVSNGLYETKANKMLPLTENHLLELGQAILQGFYRYGQLELRLSVMPVTKLAKARVDSGTRSMSYRKEPSVTSTQDSRRRRSTSIKKQSINVQELLKFKDDSKLELFTKSRTIPFQQNLFGNEILDESMNKSDREEFLTILQEIKKEELEFKTKRIDVYQGHSDSQSQGDDLQEMDLTRLHQIIESQNSDPKSSSKNFLHWKTEQRRENFKRQKTQAPESSQNRKPGTPVKTIASKYMQLTRMNAVPPKSKRLQFAQIQKIVLATRNITLQF